MRPPSCLCPASKGPCPTFVIPLAYPLEEGFCPETTGFSGVSELQERRALRGADACSLSRGVLAGARARGALLGRSASPRAYLIKSRVNQIGSEAEAGREGIQRTQLGVPTIGPDRYTRRMTKRETMLTALSEHPEGLSGRQLYTIVGRTKHTKHVLRQMEKRGEVVVVEENRPEGLTLVRRLP